MSEEVSPFDVPYFIIRHPCSNDKTAILSTNMDGEIRITQCDLCKELFARRTSDNKSSKLSYLYKRSDPFFERVLALIQDQSTH